MTRLSLRLRPEVLEDRTVPSQFADFNGDGLGDLAVGAPGANNNGLQDVGAVHIIYGKQDLLSTRAGLSADNAQIILQDTFPLPFSVAEEFDRFGATLAVGDFDGDGYSDLAVGSPTESYDGGLDAAGLVHVLYGSADGLTGARGQAFQQGSSPGFGIGDTIESFNHFGEVLTVGDFNGDTRDDLAIGVPLESVAEADQAGLVHIVYGSPTGLVRGSFQVWTEINDGTPEVPENLDNFGAALTAGDFNGDGRDELAISAPLESLVHGHGAGFVCVLQGTPGGLIANGQFWTQDSYGIADMVEDFDRFGAALAAGDFNGDGKDDLAIGVPQEDVGTVATAGSVNVIYGSGSGLTASFNQFWNQNSPNIAGASEQGDRFGASLAAGDFNGDGKDDLVIGVPIEDLGTATAAGAVHVLYGSASRLSANFSQLWTQGSNTSNSLGVGEVPEASDRFGESLVVGDFDGNGKDDLAIGVPGEELEGIDSAGAVHVLYGTANRLSIARLEFWTQAALGLFGDPGDGFGSSLGGR